IDCWSHAALSLSSLSRICNDPATEDVRGRVNRLMTVWPKDDILPAAGIDEVKNTHKKLMAGLTEMKAAADNEIKAFDETIERLHVLIALRRAEELAPPPQEKRTKRPRAHSPPAASTPSTPALTTNGRGSSIPHQRSSAGPQPSIPFSREPKARREALAKQLPLSEGRMVAFHPPSNTGKPAEAGAADTDDTTWILAKVTKCINQDKNRYEVQDVEPQEDGQPGQCYNTTLRAIIPLPDAEAPASSAAHLNAYQEFPVGSTVMALYPDTSCFYRAEVVASPRDLHPSGRNPAAKGGMYKLKFEDDDDQEHTVSAQWVVEWPGP
ncbi:hypothetical protein EVG20_g10780, partial [Dentipellis fragilis]